MVTRTAVARPSPRRGAQRTALARARTQVRHEKMTAGGVDRGTVTTVGPRPSPPTVADPRELNPYPTVGARLNTVWAVGLGVLAACSTFSPGQTLRYGMLFAILVVATNLSPRTRPSTAAIFLGLLTTHACLSWFWATERDATLGAAISQIGVLAIFLAVRAVVADRSGFLLVGGGYLLGCIWTLRQISTLNPAAAFSLRFTSTRFGIPGLNPNYAAYAFVGGILLLGALYWTPYSRSRLLRVLSVALAILLAWGVTLSGTRGAAIGCACLAAWLLVCRLFPLRPALTTLVIVIAAVGFGTVSGIVDPVLRNFDGLWSRRTGDLAGRLTIWPRARNEMAEHPVWGLGHGNFAATDPTGIAAHNLLLETAVGLGGIGLVLLGLFLVAAFRVTAADPPARLVAIGSFIAASAPIYLSGAWDLAPAGWVILALFTRTEVLADRDDTATSSPGPPARPIDRA